MDLFTRSGAVFSACGLYRYRLWRTWDANRPSVLFLMLNPSTADEEANDPTVERCQRRALGMGFGGLQVANIFAWRSTDPNGLYQASDPIGPENDKAILDAAGECAMVICAWGTHGAFKDRGKQVSAMLAHADVQALCLGQNADGSPKHPLYVAYERTPIAMA